MKINCIIIEDEPLAAERIKNYVQKLTYLNLIGSFENALDAIDIVRNKKIDLIFLDIHLGDLSGIQFLESLKMNSEVIFTTAYHQYALKAFELNVADYLLKPITLERFIQAVEKVQHRISLSRKAFVKNHIFIKTDYHLEKIDLEAILFIESNRDNCNIKLLNNTIHTQITLKEFESLLPSQQFCRVHKSFIVALNRIEIIEKTKIYIKEFVIPISETYKLDFFDLLNLKGNNN